MNKWLNDTDMFYIQNSKKKMLFVTVKWQVINAEGILELDKLFVCKNHSNNDFRHISKWMLKPRRNSLQRNGIFM